MKKKYQWCNEKMHKFAGEKFSSNQWPNGPHLLTHTSILIKREKLIELV